MIKENYELIALIDFEDGSTDMVTMTHPYYPNITGLIDYKHESKAIKSFRVRVHPLPPKEPIE